LLADPSSIDAAVSQAKPGARGSFKLVAGSQDAPQVSGYGKYKQKQYNIKEIISFLLLVNLRDLSLFPAFWVYSSVCWRVCTSSQLFSGGRPINVHGKSTRKPRSCCRGAFRTTKPGQLIT
jgi:hypothetical protein